MKQINKQGNNQEKKKHSIKNILIWGILGLFVVSGVLQGGLMGGNNPVIARVGKRAIKISDVRKYMALIKTPEGVDRTQSQVQNYIFMKALGLIIESSLVTQECNRLKLVVSDKKVVDVITRQQQFQYDGKFSRALFLSELSRMGLSEMEYKSIQKENLLHRQWIFALQSAYTVPDRIARVSASAQLQKRNGRYYAIDYSKINVPKLNNVQLAKFYVDNIALFREDEKKNAAKSTKVMPAPVPPLVAIKEKVEKEYAKQYRKMAATRLKGAWIKLTDVHLGEVYLGVPECVIEAMFLNPVGSISSFEKDGILYTVLVEKIINTTPSDVEVKQAKEYMHASMLNDVLFAAMNLLKLRYKITVLI